VAPPVNLQNNRVNVPASTRRRDVVADRHLHTRQPFSKSLMLSAAVSKIGWLLRRGILWIQPPRSTAPIIAMSYYQSKATAAASRPSYRWRYVCLPARSVPAHCTRDKVDAGSMGITSGSGGGAIRPCPIRSVNGTCLQPSKIFYHTKMAHNLCLFCLLSTSLN